MSTLPPTFHPMLLHTDTVSRVNPGTDPNYDQNNPLTRLITMLETFEVAAEREHYLFDEAQYLVPIRSLSLYGPRSPEQDNLNPEFQDNKTDFQKQNVSDFVMGDTLLMRGPVSVDGWTGPFLRISYDAGTESELARRRGGPLGESLLLYLKVNDTAAPELLRVPYNQRAGRYELEIWGYPGTDLASKLDEEGRQALASGELIVRPELLRGSLSDFERDGKDGLYMGDVAPGNSLHPLKPLHVELAWTTQDRAVWDSLDGANHHYEFNMIVRGWQSYLEVGLSQNPHGGVGTLEYRNLVTNYKFPNHPAELGRWLNSYNFNAYRTKNHGNGFEPFMSVDYMDLHVLKPNCGIGLHRHRDNSEIFFMLSGVGYMVVGDWARMPQRERCFEIRLLKPGHFAMLKGGNLHGLMTATDEPASLFMFGGYD
jgi:mannose-6-phosphate isomerase-like protein (cupin superfamily)